MKNLLKSAAPADQDFESNFFSIAYEKLQEKLPKLLKDLIGFEVVNKEEDTKALGVFGFKSGNGQILFVPVFFVNGAVKELELLYSKNNEQFFPLSEDFAEMLLKDDPTGLGDPSEQSRAELQRNMPYADFRNFVTPPRTGKTSFASVIDYVQDGDNLTKKAFYGLMENEKYGPKFTEALLRWYPLEKIAKAVTPKIDAPSNEQHPKVEVVRPADVEKAKQLSSEQKKELYAKGYAVIDHRNSSQKSKLGIFQFEQNFRNPDMSGFYNYITEQGHLRRGLVLYHPATFLKGFASEETLVIDLEKEGGAVLYKCPSNQVYVKDRIEVPKFKEVVSKMVDASDATPNYRDRYILINEHLKATIPFSISQNFRDPNGIRRLVIDWNSNDVAQGRNVNHYQNENKLWKDYDRNIKDITLVFTKKNSDRLEHVNNMIYVPKGFKLFKVSTHSYFDDEKDKDFVKSYKHNKPGGICAMNGSLMGNNVFPLTVRTNGSDYYVDYTESKKTYKDPVSCKIGMVLDLGLDIKQAEEVVDKLIPNIMTKGYIKLAYLGESYLPMVDEQPGVEPANGAPMYTGMPWQNTAGGSDGYTGNPTQLGLGTSHAPEGIDANVDQASQMASMGQKQIFDTQSIATLAKYVNPTEKTMAYIPDFVSAMDKLGRLLFLCYWNTDKFREMYGRDDLPELVELLKNVFKNIGDLVIFLKRKTPDISINSSRTDQLAS